jgi:hypothetical protein
MQCPGPCNEKFAPILSINDCLASTRLHARINALPLRPRGKLEWISLESYVEDKPRSFAAVELPESGPEVLETWSRRDSSGSGSAKLKRFSNG